MSSCTLPCLFHSVLIVSYLTFFLPYFKSMFFYFCGCMSNLWHTFNSLLLECFTVMIVFPCVPCNILTNYLFSCQCVFAETFTAIQICFTSFGHCNSGKETQVFLYIRTYLHKTCPTC